MERRWRIGELADATGLTVRTIHHYEHIGLLAPAARSDGHQRLYDENDVRRLFRVRALRDLGFGLADIAQILDGDGEALGDLLRAHLVRVDTELERLQRLRLLLDRACVQAERLVEPDDVLQAIEAMSRVARRIAERDVPNDAEDHWRALGRELRDCMDAGESPAGPRAQAIARTAQRSMRAFAGNDRATLDALAALRRFDPPDSLAGWDPALVQYLDQALAALTPEDETC